MHEERKNMTEVELQEYWRDKFCEEFKKNFGYEPVLKKYYSEEDFILVLNYYGIKSPWL